LAAVYGAVKQLEGYIDVTSQLGKGTTFNIYLPKTDRKRQALTGTSHSSSPVGNETILVVEDQETVRRFVKIALARFGYRVIEADSAETALAALANRQTQIHLLLTDVVLSGMPGTELASHLRADRPHMPVLLMSGYTSDRFRDGMMALEGAEWIEKPFTAQTLLKKIRQVLG
jgi:DNA-binding NtrC family response regulator